MSDDAKRIVLARRAGFVAAAVASLGIACGKEKADPGPCLSIAYQPPDAADPMPVPCLSTPMPVRDAAADGAVDTAADAGGDAAVRVGRDGGKTTIAKPAPHPCLSIAPPETPQRPECTPPYVIAPDGTKRTKKECE